MDSDQVDYNGRITFLFRKDGAYLELEDEQSSILFVKIYLNQDQLVRMLSAQACVHCHIETKGLEKIGKKMEISTLEFPLPEHDFCNREEIAIEEAKKLCPPDWECDYYFRSQKSFYYDKDGKTHARATIRRWINEKNNN